LFYKEGFARDLKIYARKLVGWQEADFEVVGPTLAGKERRLFLRKSILSKRGSNVITWHYC